MPYKLDLKNIKNSEIIFIQIIDQRLFTKFIAILDN